MVLFLRVLNYCYESKRRDGDQQKKQVVSQHGVTVSEQNGSELQIMND
jgi:hypothetical protein